MMIHNSPSDVLSSSDLRMGISDDSDNSMVKQNQSESHQYLLNHHSDSSRSSSICSSSLSPKNSSSTTATVTTLTTAAASVGTVVANVDDFDPVLAQHVEYELGLTKKNGSGTRKNAWGNLSYAELISKAITSSAAQRLTLSEIYDWMIKYVPFFRTKVDRNSSAGWKNSIRHNLSLHNKFKRVQSEGTGKSSWWMINPDEKSTSGNGTSSSTGIKQPRRRSGQGMKTSLSSTTPKRLRTSRSTKASRRISTTQQLEQEHRIPVSQQVQPSDMSIISVYEAQPWASHLETDNGNDHLFDSELYSTTIRTPTTNNTGNSTGCIQSTYSYEDLTTNYVNNTSSNNNNNNHNTSDYLYHHPHHYHSQHSHTLYQHHHGPNYDTNSTNRYYHQQSALNNHHSNPCSLSIDTYHTNHPGTYALQHQQQQIDPNDEHIYLHAHSTSSHSSSSPLSPSTLTTNNNILPSSSSGSSSSNYTHSQKSSSTGGFLHPTSNGTVTLYSHHHHQNLSHHPHPYHSDIETLLQLNHEVDDINDDDDDLSTLVHHHGVIDDQQQLSSFFQNNNHNHQSHSHNDSSTSILRTVLNRPIVDMYNQQV